MGAIFELGTAASDQFDIGLMHQSGGIERVTLVAAKMTARHCVQLGIQGGQHTVQRTFIAATGGVEP